MCLFLGGFLLTPLGHAAPAPSPQTSDPSDLITRKELYLSQLGKIGKDVKILKRRQRGVDLNLLNFGWDLEFAYDSSRNLQSAYDSEEPDDRTDKWRLNNLRTYFVVSPSDWIFWEGTYRFNTTPNFDHTVDGIYNQHNLQYWQDFFVTLGNLNHSPFFATVGKQYIPFGNFKKLSVSTDPLTKDIFRMNADAITLGHVQGNHLSTLSFYQGDEHLAVAAQYENQLSLATAKPSKIRYGVGVASEVFTMTKAFESIQPEDESSLPVLDLFAEYWLGPFAFKTEFDQVLNKAQNGKYLTVFDVEGQYGFNMLTLPNAVSLAYSRSINSENLVNSYLPEEQWILSYKVQFKPHTYLGFSYALANTTEDNKYSIFVANLILKF